MESTESTESEELIKMTVDALRSSQPGLDQFHKIFMECSTHFDKADDHEGLEKLKKLLPQLKEFAVFCASIMDICNSLLEEEISNDLIKKCLGRCRRKYFFSVQQFAIIFEAFG